MKTYPEKLKEKISTAIKEGSKMSAIAKKHGVPYHVVTGLKGKLTPPKTAGQPEKVVLKDNVQSHSTGLSNTESPAFKYFEAVEIAKKQAAELNNLRLETLHLRALVHHYLGGSCV